MPRTQGAIRRQRALIGGYGCGCGVDLDPQHRRAGRDNLSSVIDIVLSHLGNICGPGAQPEARGGFTEDRSLKKDLCLLAVAIIGAGLVASAHAQNANSPAASAQGETPEVRGVAIA
jgi:hypothetical protein